MKKSELLKIMNQELLDKLFGFCYARTADSHEAEELCSDIIFALVKNVVKNILALIHVEIDTALCVKTMREKNGFKENLVIYLIQNIFI